MQFTFQPGSHWRQGLTQIMQNQPQVKLNCLDSRQMRFSVSWQTIIKFYVLIYLDLIGLTQIQNQPQVKMNCLDSCQMRFSVS